MHRHYRLAYLSGPIDAAKVYHEWRKKEESEYFGTIYLTHLYALLDEFESDGLIITTLPSAPLRQELDHIIIVNIPMPVGRTGVAYHLAMLWWSIRCVLQILRFRSDAALLTAGQDYFWLFAILRLFGVKLAASLHCALWPRFAPRKLHQKIFTHLNGRLFYPACEHIQGVSEEVVSQIVRSSSSLRLRPKRFIATYDPARFEAIQHGEWPTHGQPFRLLFVGRIEVNKGVLDLVDIMFHLEKKEPGRFRLDICGEGAAAGQMNEEIRKKGVEHIVTVRGQCSTSLLAKLYAESHVVVIPTRSNFEEGAPKIAFEAVLNLRPIVMSAACPAITDVPDATVEARVDDVADYVVAIRKLANDSSLYAEKVSAAEAYRWKNFDEGYSYGMILRSGLARLVAAN